MNLIVIFATFKMCSSIFTLWNKMRNKFCLIRMDMRRNQPVKFVGSRRPVLYSSAFWPTPNPERDYCICLGGAGPPHSPPSASPVPHGIPDGWLSEMTEWSSVAAWNKQVVYMWFHFGPLNINRLINVNKKTLTLVAFQEGPPQQIKGYTRGCWHHNPACTSMWRSLPQPAGLCEKKNNEDDNSVAATVCKRHWR